MNAKIILGIIVALIILITGVYFAGGRFPQEDAGALNNVADWKTIDADKFTISAPEGWELKPAQGIDSYVGEITNGEAILSFDYGWYSSPITQEGDTVHEIIYEKIGGYDANIVKPKAGGFGRTGVYFSDLGGSTQPLKFNLYGENLSPENEAIVLQMIRTLKFQTSEQIR